MTLRGWLLIGGATLLVAAGAYGAGRVLLPKLKAAEVATEKAVDQGVSEGLSREGAETMTDAVTTYAAQGGRIVEKTYELRIEASRAPDADASLDAGRAERLGAHDRFLCGERPALCAADAPAGEGTRPSQ